MVNIGELLNLPHLEGDLAVLDAALHRAVETDDAFLTEVAGHLIRAGGKRLRPALVLASAQSGGVGATDDVIQGGVSVELVHLGSLYHDDVIDEATSRRGVPSVNARWGNLVAILAGDFLLARASEIATDLSNEVAGLLAATISRLCEGQLRELTCAFDVTRTEDAYLQSISGKTGSLMSASCRIGGLTAGLNGPQVDALTAFGEAFGMVFQIRDDLLDVLGTDEELGKPAGQDLVEGTYSLPVICALADRDAGPELRELLGRPMGAPERDKARSMIRDTQGISEARRVALRYAEKAAEAMDGHFAGPVADAMGRLGYRLLDDIPAWQH